MKFYNEHFNRSIQNENEPPTVSKSLPSLSCSLRSACTFLTTPALRKCSVEAILKNVCIKLLKFENGKIILISNNSYVTKIKRKSLNQISKGHIVYPDMNG